MRSGRQEVAERRSAFHRRRLVRFVLAGAVVAVSTAVGVLSLSVQTQRPPADTPDHARIVQPLSTVPVPSSVPLVRYELQPKTLDDLLTLPADDLAKVEIARMNLLCATGLPGAEKLDVEHALTSLDAWAQRVQFETERHLYRVTEPRYAEHYRHSEAYFRAEMLLQVLQQDLGVKYDMSAVGNFSFADSRVAFIHGMIPMPGQTLADTPGGTCASMPVMYVAIGRRLGYPLKLATTRGHVFGRWEGKDHVNPVWREQFNIEGSGDGFSSYEDEHYKEWPAELSEEEVRANGYLASLSPAEELAEFLASRGHCGIDNGRSGFAARCFENAYRYDASRPAYRVWLVDAALVSDYRPVTPELIRLLDQKRRVANRHRMAPELDFPLPSSVARAGGYPIGVTPPAGEGPAGLSTPVPLAPVTGQMRQVANPPGWAQYPVWSSP